MRLAARVVALVTAACGSLAAAGMPPACAATPLPSSLVAAGSATTTIPDADQADRRITITAVTPAVLRPGDTLLVSGTVNLTTLPTEATPTIVRLIRNRSAVSTRHEVEEWSAHTGPTVAGAEVARQTLDLTAPRAVVPFQLTVPADQLRLSRAFGVIPVAVELTTVRGTAVSVQRTFVGWQRSADYQPLSVAWLLPVTLAPDPALDSDDQATRTAAWSKQVGPGSRLDVLLRATASRTVGYAVDPAVLGPAGQTAAQTAADAASAVRSGFATTLSTASATHPVFALPQNDPDVAALTSPTLTPDLISAATRLVSDEVTQSARLADAAITTRGTLAWPADGALPSARETALRAAYGSKLDAVLVSTQVTDPSARLTPPTAGVAPLGTRVLRWDDPLGSLLSRLRTPGESVLAAQEMVAQTAALLGERPSIARTILVVPARGFDAGLDADVLSTFLAAAEQVPWLRTVGADTALTPGLGPDSAPALPTEAPTSRADAAGGLDGAASASTVTRVFQERATISTLSALLLADSPTIARWSDLPAQLASTRWRSDPAGREALLASLEAQTATVANGLSVVPQTTNFLADEGVVQLTLVNALAEPVRGVRAVLAPGNGRIVVVDPGAPVDIAPNAKATVSVRLAVLAQGLVPVNAWVTSADGTRIGTVQQLTIRASPPGAWLYVTMSMLFGLILIAGIVRAVRRPPRVVVDTQGLDPVDPTPEAPVVAPVQRHTAP